jgi:hypothetical protein
MLWDYDAAAIHKTEADNQWAYYETQGEKQKLAELGAALIESSPAARARFMAHLSRCCSALRDRSSHCLSQHLFKVVMELSSQTCQGSKACKDRSRHGDARGVRIGRMAARVFDRMIVRPVNFEFKGHGISRKKTKAYRIVHSGRKCQGSA